MLVTFTFYSNIVLCGLFLITFSCTFNIPLYVWFASSSNRNEKARASNRNTECNWMRKTQNWREKFNTLMAFCGGGWQNENCQLLCFDFHLGIVITSDENMVNRFTPWIHYTYLYLFNCLEQQNFECRQIFTLLSRHNTKTISYQ